MSWIPLAPLPVKLGWNNTFAQRKRQAPTVMFPSGSSQVFSLSVDLSTVSKSTPMQHRFLLDIPSNLPVCGGNEGVPLVSQDLHQILCEVHSQLHDGWCDAECHFRRWALRRDTSVVRPETYKTLWVAMYMAGTLNASNLVCVMFAERHGVLDSSKDSAETEGCLVSV